MNLIGPINNRCGVGYLDEQGNVRIPFDYQSLGRFSDGLAWCVLEGKLGYIDPSNNLVIAPRFTIGKRLALMNDFHSGLAAIRVNSTEGYISKTGDVVIPCKFALCSPFVGDVALAVEQGAHSVSAIDLTGSTISRLAYPHVVEVPYAPDLIKVYTVTDSETLNPAFVDRLGNLVAGPFSQFEEVGKFNENPPHFAFIRSRESGLAGFVDPRWHTAIPAVFGNVGEFSEGMASASTPDHKWGYINESGDWLIPPKYTYAHRFSGGTASVRVGNGRASRWQIINREDQLVSSHFFEDIGSEFDEGFRKVSVNGRTTVIDRNCSVIWRAD